MEIADRICELSILPSRFNIMLERALYAIWNDQEREELCVVACAISSATWQIWQAWRPPADNRQEHEWVVFDNVMKIAESEKLCLSDRRIATAFCFIHDTFFIKRIMEEEIRNLERKGMSEEADELRKMKKKQRTEHMTGGAENARFLLNRLKHPDDPSLSLFSPVEIQRVVDIVSKHDLWKVDPPNPPPTEDRLALACLEGDALWPMHPIGVLADLERADNKGMTKDSNDASNWRKQLEQSLQTLVEFRAKWEAQKIPKDDFMDEESIFRTEEGHRLYSEWRKLWNL